MQQFDNDQNQHYYQHQKQQQPQLQNLKQSLNVKSGISRGSGFLQVIYLVLFFFVNKKLI